MLIYVWITALFGFFHHLISAQEGYQKAALQLHNQYRSRHHTIQLLLDANLNNVAVECAKYYANRNKIDHSCPSKNRMGENLWLGRGGNWSPEETAQSAINAWYNEEKDFDYKNPENRSDLFHFTQVVWQSSEKLGFGYARLNGTTVGVALYTPPGNVRGQFEKNVPPPKN